MLLDIYGTEQIYHKEYDFFCFDSCVRQILESYGNPYLCFIINFSIGFEMIIKKDSIQMISEKDYDCLLPEYLNKFHIYEGFQMGQKYIWEENKRLIQKGYPIIVDVDTYYLSYLPYFNKSHGKHAIIIAGYDEDMVTIIDWFSTWLFKGKISDKELWNARLPGGQLHTDERTKGTVNGSWAYLEEMKQKDLNVAELIRRNIDLTLNQYYRKSSNVKGVQALKELIRILQEKRNFSMEMVKGFIADLCRSLHITAMRKSLFTLFLDHSYAVTGEKMIHDCLDDAIIDVQIWKKLIYYLMRGSYKPETSVTKIIDLLQEIVYVETKQMLQLEELMQKKIRVNGRKPN